ncbi:MAG TPA: UDP-N-acetyl-D-mannosamine dehydrogenase [Polyangiaceae bacterium]|nr:UDP-N-acetyl-D-mannosamine dehydrogenase [Polyangiaceae bacterium]
MPSPSFAPSPQTTQVCVVGLGYIGLPTAAILASRGYSVHGVEVDARAAEIINAGRAHIVEPDLDLLVRAAVETKRLAAHPEPAPADIFVLCVPTPVGPGHAPDLSYVQRATRSLCPVLRPGNLVILESTSPPGTTEMIAGIVAEQTGLGPGELFFAHAPERVLPGQILREVVQNDRIVGGVDRASGEVCAAFYRTFVAGEVFVTDARMAETVKLVENAYRDVNIAFANELSVLADRLSLDVWDLIALANRHPRVNILRPGPGVGGHCIAVDPWFLVHAVPDATALIRQARATNSEKPSWVVERITRRAERLKRARIACLGLAYKPDIDDLRESPALEVVQRLAAAGSYDLRIVEPHLARHPELELSSLEAALDGADIVVFLVAHRAFRHIPRPLLNEKIVIDTCGALR